jgi:hypothetical protein
VRSLTALRVEVDAMNYTRRTTQTRNLFRLKLMAIIEHGVRGTTIRSRLPILVQGSPCGEIESINRYAVTLAGYIYMLAPH